MSRRGDGEMVKHYERRGRATCLARASLAYRVLHVQEVTCLQCLRVLRREVREALEAAGQRDSAARRLLQERAEQIAEALAVAEAREWLQDPERGEGCSK